MMTSVSDVVEKIEPAIVEEPGILLYLRQQVPCRDAVRGRPGRVEDEVLHLVAKDGRLAVRPADLRPRFPDDLPVTHDVDPKTGKARGQKVLWNTVLFPYDRNLNPDGAVPEGLSISDIATTHDLRDERITEEYFLDEYGIITSRISRSVQDNFTSCHNLYRRT